MKKFFGWALLAALTLLATGSASAHFIWVAVENDSAGKPAVQIWFSELAEADDENLIDKITHTKAWLHKPGAEPTLLTLKKVVADGGGALVAPTSAKAPYSATAICKYGVIERGGKVFLLNYYAKYLEADAESLKTLGRAESLVLDVVPKTTNDGFELEVLWQGKPAPKCEVTINTPDAAQEKFTTDEHGKVKLPAKQAGLYSIRAKFAEDVTGKEGDKEYKQSMHYSTLSLRKPK